MSEFDNDFSNELNEVSKSELKRQSTAKQDLGVRLCELSSNQLEELELSDSLSRAIRDFIKIRNKGSKAYGALKRQKQYLGKVMRNLEDDEVDTIKQYFIKLDNHSQQEIQRFHAIENWRDKLLTQGDEAIDALYASQITLDFSHRQSLRQIIRQHQKELKKRKSDPNNTAPQRAPKTTRQMFKYLRDEVFTD